MSTVEQRQESVVVVMTLLLLLSALALWLGFAQRAEFKLKPHVTAQQQAKIDPVSDPQGHAKQLRDKQLTERFEQGVAMLHAKRYDFAVTALHRVLELAPTMPEANVNMGFALLGLENYKAAGDFFAAAIRVKPYQGNAYWGLAVALDHLGDKEGALGAMRTYIHLAKPDDPYLRKARSALWEWENHLKRGPLPKEEAEWLEKRGKEWDERNSPAVDAANSNDSGVDLISKP
ncbi:MAG: hypothetical protein FD130_490 [Halothiobacillaceae bacterium]|nr:MAG: hypothetical protein FD130_490 [Halothiobacillaceae bacterium]